MADYYSDPEASSSSDDDDGNPINRGRLDDKPQTRKILFCSRTHSQLSQFIHEVKASPFGTDARAVVLGSRQTLCINEKVLALKSLTQINDRCKDLQGKKSKADGKKHKGCPYLDHKRVRFFADRTLTEIQDVEELRGLGSRTQACPYYGTRDSVSDAEIVAMPYNLLLHKSSRESVGVKLEGNIVLVDEAHNLLPAIEAIHSNALSGSLLERAHAQLLEYRTRYQKRMNPQNVMYVDQILTILRAFLKFVDDCVRIGGGNSVLSVNDFVFQTEIDNINMFRLVKYFENSEISKKVNGFVLKQSADASTAVSMDPTQAHGTEYVSRHVSALKSVETFILSLTNADRDGKLVIQPAKHRAKVELKFLLLNPAVYFEDILLGARAVVLAGGTMSPMKQFTDELCIGKTANTSVTRFSCGHVIPSQNLTAMTICCGPSGASLNFCYRNRCDPQKGVALLRDVGQLILNLCNVVPDGVVVFFSSYDYAEKAYVHWESNGLLAKLQQKKQVFRESQSGGPSVDVILTSYAKAIEGENGGALLFSVVGGKLSEGINFKDRLGRCVVVVGLPFPNMHSPELKEKIAFLDAKTDCKAHGTPSRGSDFYENICMKAVNQSIGRAIRHQRDYASIVLVDERYAQPRIATKLSHWIHGSLQVHNKFGPVIGTLKKFFRQHESHD